MRPLEGIKVIDFTQAHAGSLCTMLLADMGAEVVKIERVGSGDLARQWEPIREGDSGYYAYLNRGKKSIGLNTYTPEGRQIVEQLIRGADVLCENFKFGSMERMGLSYDVVKAWNPGIVYASLNGFGQTGPMKQTIGLDLQLQAMSGVMDATGYPDGAPVRVGAAFGDHLSGTYMALAVVIALREKRRTGQGQQVDIAILDALCSVMQEKLDGSPRMGNGDGVHCPCDCYETRDGYLTVCARDDGQWQGLCAALGRPELGREAKYRTAEDRLARYEGELKPLLADGFRTMDSEAAQGLLREHGVECCVVRDFRHAMDSARVKERRLLAQVEDKAMGPIRIPDSAFLWSGFSTKVTGAAPLLGEHTAHYLKQLGYDDASLAGLRASGVIQMAEEAKA